MNKRKPKGFKNPYLGVDEDGFDKEYEGYIAFEAGADAYGDALISEGVYGNRNGVRGWFVFIPKDDE